MSTDITPVSGWIKASGVVALDMLALNDKIRKLDVKGDIQFSASNYHDGVKTLLFLREDSANTAVLQFPDNWIFAEKQKPEVINNSRILLTVLCMDADSEDCLVFVNPVN